MEERPSQQGIALTFLNGFVHISLWPYFQLLPSYLSHFHFLPQQILFSLSILASFKKPKESKISDWLLYMVVCDLRQLFNFPEPQFPPLYNEKGSNHT